MNEDLEKSLEKLSGEFDSLDLTFHEFRENGIDYRKSFFPGARDEDIIVCVYRGTDIHEPFHRQDFFFFNYGYRGDYAALSENSDNLIQIRENECYIGQPFSGYALRSESGTESTIAGVLIRKDTFFREFMKTFSSDSSLFRFYLDPQKDRFSDAFLHLSFGQDRQLRTLLEMMIIEYANRGEDTQNILLPMAQTLFTLVSREFKKERPQIDSDTPVSRILEYIADHSDTVTLKEIAERFSYHPNYVSSMLHKETGKKFSEIVLEKRMERAEVLLGGTTLSIEEIAAMLGYGSTSNFYKAFRSRYHMSPNRYREGGRSGNKDLSQ